MHHGITASRQKSFRREPGHAPGAGPCLPFYAFNALVDERTKVTSTNGKVTASVLSGNREVQDWQRQLRSLAFGAVAGLSGTIDRLDDLGFAPSEEREAASPPAVDEREHVDLADEETEAFERPFDLSGRDAEGADDPDGPEASPR